MRGGEAEEESTLRTKKKKKKEKEKKEVYLRAQAELRLHTAVVWGRQFPTFDRPYLGRPGAHGAGAGIVRSVSRRSIEGPWSGADDSTAVVDLWRWW
ncbi:hypothetical protein ABG768_015832 [Culter alburnus]|uniref:Uncharacterized protein n=1 Tax=Culter alburnus TaxID=194366 RepID=A0AAW1YYF6_CULAL